MKSLTSAAVLIIAAIGVISLIYTTAMFGIETTFKCGSLESVPVAEKECWQPFTGNVKLD